MGKNKHPVECACHKAEREQQEAAIKAQKHLDLVRRLKADGFLIPLCWTGHLQTTTDAAHRCTMHTAM